MQNDPDKSLGRIADALVRDGVQLDVRSPDRALPSVLRYAGLVVLPGLADPVDEDIAVQRVRDTIQEALQADLPILGLCLGGQLLVQALGGSVYPCRAELGFREVIAAPAASSDPLLGAGPEQFSVLHAHAFAFEPPADAEILLTNDVCIQACRHGDTWAFQCHPEISPEWVRALAAGLRGEDGGLRAATTDFFQWNGVAPEQLERDAELADPALCKIAANIASGFAAQLARAPRTVEAAQASINHVPPK
ncbi:MAG: gamma-glutamyl-gamma-aminobutyrate hydrolase family protein [Actinomycetota bacterium]|nr:gamma-glutamyl-gamma-aminobutyrate hydrolase family protein [Actinomycetota bacterium]